MFEQEQTKLLHDAARRFPEGCLCEDSGECAYCRFIMNYLAERNMNCTVGVHKWLRNLVLDNVQFNIPIGEAEQIYELGRMFIHPS